MESALDRVRKLRAEGKLNLQDPVAVEVRPPPPKPKTGLAMTKEEAMAVFGHNGFRPGQEEVVDEVLNGTKGVMVVFPTGYGKSLTYQVPALMMEGMSIVVSPLIALMKDQVDRLQSRGIGAVLINSSLTPAEEREALTEVASGSVKVIYVSPERFENKSFCSALKELDISLLAIDEAHCISRWGHDFRPAYADLGPVAKWMQPKQVMALTATATTRVQDDICTSLGLLDAARFVRGVYRPNLELGVVEGLGMRRVQGMAEVVSSYVAQGQGTGIVYTVTKRAAEEICGYFKKCDIRASFYHAGLPGKQRTEIQEDWAKNGGVIVATCAFGMGIDKDDVRFVLHSGLSQSIEDWYQEIGRAGRDGKPALCASFWDYGDDYRTQMFLIDLTNPSGGDIRRFWTWLKAVAKSEMQPGCKTVTVNMTQKVMAESSGCVNVGGCIGYLKRSGHVATLGRGKYRVDLERADLVNFDELEEVRQAKIEKVNEVVRFYRSRDCRMAEVCGYFGDMSFSGGCKVCDNCRG